MTQRPAEESDPASALGPVLAVDVGGTTMKAEIQAADGAVLARSTAPTPRGAAVVPAVAGLGRELLPVVPGVSAAGIVVPGLVDPVAGVARYSANIGWRDLALTDPLSHEWGLDVRLGHDVMSGAVAEISLGAGRGHAEALFVILGTGVAAVAVSGGRILTGAGGQIAELGHIDIPGGAPCPCGGRSCLEPVGSAAAIAKRYAEVSGRAGVGADEVARLVATDPDAADVWDSAVTALAEAIGIVSLLLAPSVVVLGGGLAQAGAVLVAPLADALESRARIHPVPQLITASFGARAGVVGAGLLARGGWPT